MPGDQIGSWVVPFVHRLDTEHRGWRDLCGAKRPVSVVAHRHPANGANRSHPIGRIDLIDFLSRTWPKKVGSRAWTFLYVDSGSQLSHVQVEVYLRSGGLIAAISDANWAAIPLGAAPARESAELISGHENYWFATVSSAQMALVQLGNAGFIADESAVSELIDLVSALWHPLLGWHVDPIDALARGFDRHRFTSRDFEERARLTIHSLTLTLAQHGVVARPILLAS